jgi:hypothetical protein
MGEMLAILVTVSSLMLNGPDSNSTTITTADPTHPDLPAAPMCDPMPVWIEVCHWDPTNGLAGVACPAGYVRTQVAHPGSGTCPNLQFVPYNSGTIIQNNGEQ